MPHKKKVVNATGRRKTERGVGMKKRASVVKESLPRRRKKEKSSNEISSVRRSNRLAAKQERPSETEKRNMDESEVSRAKNVTVYITEKERSVADERLQEFKKNSELSETIDDTRQSDVCDLESSVPHRDSTLNEKSSSTNSSNQSVPSYKKKLGHDVAIWSSTPLVKGVNTDMKRKSPSMSPIHSSETKHKEVQSPLRSPNAKSTTFTTESNSNDSYEWEKLGEKKFTTESNSNDSYEWSKIDVKDETTHNEGKSPRGSPNNISTTFTTESNSNDSYEWEKLGEKKYAEEVTESFNSDSCSTSRNRTYTYSSGSSFQEHGDEGEFTKYTEEPDEDEFPQESSNTNWNSCLDSEDKDVRLLASTPIATDDELKKKKSPPMSPIKLQSPIQKKFSKLKK